MNVCLSRCFIIQYRKLNCNAVESIIKIMLWVMSEFLLISTHFMSPLMSKSKLRLYRNYEVFDRAFLTACSSLSSFSHSCALKLSNAFFLLCVSYLYTGRSQCIVQSWECQWVEVRKSCSKKCVGVLPGRIKGKVWRNKPWRLNGLFTLWVKRLGLEVHL